MRKTFFVSAILVILAAAAMATGIEVLWAAKKQVADKLKSNPDMKAAKTILRRYREAPGVSMDVEKKVARALLGDEKVSRGRLFSSKGKLRLEIDSPEKSLLIADQKQVWMVVELPEDLGGKIHVSKLQLQKNGAKAQARSNSLVALLFGDDQIWDQFALVEASEKEGIKTLELRPKKPAEMEDLSRVQVRLNEKEKLIVGIQYADDLDNTVAYSFSAADFKAKVKKEQFVYRPPKGAEVVEY